MEFMLSIVLILILTLIGLIIFNYKLKISTSNIAYIIVGLSLGLIIALMLTYNMQSACDMIINHNNITLQLSQEKCFQYLNF